MMAARNQYEGWMSKRFSRSNLNQSPNVMPPRILGPNHSKKRLRHDMVKSSWMTRAAGLMLLRTELSRRWSFMRRSYPPLTH